MTTIERVEREQPAPTADPQQSHGRPWLFVALAAVLAAALGFAAGWLAFDRDDAADDGAAVPEEVLATVDRFLVAFETNDFALLEDVVTRDFRRPFYVGDPDGSPWRDVFRTEAYEFMDDPDVSDATLVFYDIEAVGEPIVRGNGPWYVAQAQNWREGERPNQYESVQTFVVVEVDGEYLIDDAYWAGTTVLVTDE